MPNHFQTRHYGEPSASAAKGEQELLADLKAAQSELTVFERDANKTKIAFELSSHSSNTQTAPGTENEFLKDWIENCSKKVESEKSRLQDMKVVLEQCLGRVSERLGKIQELQDAVEKTKKNMEVLGSEISSLERVNGEVLGQLKRQFHKLSPAGKEHIDE